MGVVAHGFLVMWHNVSGPIMVSIYILSAIEDPNSKNNTTYIVDSNF